jgi:MscS family membrane protein
VNFWIQARAGLLLVLAALVAVPGVGLHGQGVPGMTGMPGTGDAGGDATGDATSGGGGGGGSESLGEEFSHLAEEFMVVATEKNEVWQFLALFGCLFGGMAAAKAIGLVLGWVARRRRAGEGSLRWLTIKALSRSLVLFGLVLGLKVGALFLTFTPAVASFYEALVQVLFIVALAVLGFQLTDVPTEWMRRRVEATGSGMGKLMVPLLRSSLRVAIVIFALLQVVEVLSDKSLTSILAGLGIGGLAVAFAAQDMLKNFFGSMMLLSDRPFEMGDRIILGEHDGTIESLGVRSTRIRRLDGHLVTVPNGVLANETIHNVAKRPFIRRILNVTVTYDTPPEKIEEGKQIIRELLKDESVNQGDLLPRVYFNDYNAASLNIIVIYWFHPPAYWEFMEHADRFNTELLRRFNEAGIAFAFPTQTIHLAREDGGDEGGDGAGG